MMRLVFKRGQTLWLMGLVAVFTANLASADTYNFFFKDKPKKAKKQDSSEEPDVSVSEGDSEPTYHRKSKAVNPLTSPANGEEEVGGDHSQLEPGQLPPIIINNNNNIGVPQPQAPPLQAENDARDVRSDVELMAGPPTRSSSLSPWRFGAGLNLVKEARSGMGGSLSLGYMKERGLGWNFFAGIRDNSLLYPTGKNWHLGGELELLPIQSHETESGVSVFQAGILAGLSTISAHPDNWVSLHTGARVNLNFADNVGLSLVYRVNLGYMMGEAAIVTRL